MLKNAIFISLFIALLSCSTKKNITHTPTIQEKPKIYFPEKEISDSIIHFLDINNDSITKSIYNTQQNKLIWSNDTLIQQGITWLKDSQYDGFNPNQFCINKIDSLYQTLKTDSLKYISNYAKLDIELTINIRKCGYRKRFSPLNPVNFHRGWNYKAPEALTHDSVWVNLIKKGKIYQLNSFFRPKNPIYAKLTIELENIYKTNSQTSHIEIVNPGFLLQKGDSNQYVLPLKRKLLHIPKDSAISMAFDETLSIALKKFQTKHGLTPDGIAGKQTYHYLNWKTELYIDILKANLERLRWYNDDQFTDGFLINIANQQLELKNNDTCYYKSRVVVGKYKNQTQVFCSEINYLVFNPCWTIPQSIASTQILRGAQRDSLYLQKRNMFVCTNGIEIPTDSIDFTLYSSSNFPFKVFQRTSASNALGKVKFMFKNNFSIYLHDTPQQKLFDKPVRTYSHGCIRVENALHLADITINKVDKQNVLIDRYLQKGYPVKVYLKKNIPIHITYFTCWFDKTLNEIIYGKDVYMKDYDIIKALKNQ